MDVFASEPLASRRQLLVLVSVVGLYAALRIIAWSNTVLLDDTDSMFYLAGIDAYYSMDWNTINRLNSDSTPFLPALGALVKFVVGDTESAARLLSFIASLVLVTAVGLLARKLYGNTAAVLAVFVLALNGTMVSLSAAVLSEPSYIGTIYVGFYLLWKQLEDPTLNWKWAAALGLLFGLAFLNRTEGIVYLVAVPFAIFLLGWLVRDRQKRPNVGKVAGWSMIYAVIFLALAIPQILHVSSKMGAPAINGRIAWQALVTGMHDRSRHAAIFGLDFAEDQINVSYIRSNYKDALHKLGPSGRNAINVAERTKQALRNLDRIYRKLLGEQITPLGFTLAVVGLIALYLRGEFRGCLFGLFMFAVLIAGPVAHTNVNSRHLSAVIPLLCIFQGIGLRHTAILLTRRVHNFALPKAALWVVLIAILLAGNAFPLKHALRPPHVNKEYDPKFLVEPVRLIKDMEHVSSISAQRGYIAYLAGTHFIYAPYAHYQELVRYLEANDVSLLYADFDRLADYPYINKFQTDGYQQDFERIWVGERNGRPRAALFKLRSDPTQ